MSKRNETGPSNPRPTPKPFFKPTSILTSAFGVTENIGKYMGHTMPYAVVPDFEKTAADTPSPIAYAADDATAFKIAKMLSEEFTQQNPACAGCAAFGDPAWEGERDGRTGSLGSDEGWYHFTGGIHPFKEKYIWCVAKNKKKVEGLDPDAAQ